MKVSTSRILLVIKPRQINTFVSKSFLHDSCRDKEENTLITTCGQESLFQPSAWFILNLMISILII